jgi:hypothetical protein
MSKSKNKRGYSLAVFLTLVLVGAVESARAEIVTFNFTGAITSVFGTPFGLSTSVGQEVSGSFTYDTSQMSPSSPCSISGFVAGYIQSPPTYPNSGMSVVIAGVTLKSLNFNSFQVLDNCSFGGSPVDNINGFFTPISVGGVSQSNSSSISLGATRLTKSL